MNTINFFFLGLVVLVLMNSCATRPEIPPSPNTIGLFYPDTAVVPKEELRQFLKEAMDSLNIPGISFALINDGKVVFHSATGIANVDSGELVDDYSIFEAASMSKPVFAYFTLKMAEKSIIDLDRPLSFFLPDSSMAIEPEYRWVTARMVLNHTTGFPNWRWFDDIPDSLDIKRGTFFLQDKPGNFTYSGEAYQYLARVLANNNFVNLNELAQVVQKEVFSPLGMDRAYFVWDDYLYENKVYGHRNGENQGRDWGAGLPHLTSKTLSAAGGLHTEAANFSKFIIALLNEEGLQKGTFEAMFEKQTEIPADNPFHKNFGITGFGLGLQVSELNGKRFYGHGGNNGSFTSGFLMDREAKNAYVFFINNENGDKFTELLKEFLVRP